VQRWPSTRSFKSIRVWKSISAILKARGNAGFTTRVINIRCCNDPLNLRALRGFAAQAFQSENQGAVTPATTGIVRIDGWVASCRIVFRATRVTDVSSLEAPVFKLRAYCGKFDDETSSRNL
jgi:hypothetical protein